MLAKPTKYTANIFVSIYAINYFTEFTVKIFSSKPFLKSQKGFEKRTFINVHNRKPKIFFKKDLVKNEFLTIML
jgi:hypothetical protein